MPLAKWRKYPGMNARFFIDRRSVAVSALLLVALPSQAQAPLDGHLLGITEQALQASFTALHRVSKPLPGPHGLRGLWALANTSVSGLPFETTFYLKNRYVHRIEQRWTSTANQCAILVIYKPHVVEDASTL